MALTRKLRYIAFFITISLACLFMASDAPVKILATPLFVLASLFLWRKEVTHSYRRPIIGKEAVLVAVFAALFVLFMIVSAISGWTKESNDWYSKFEYRPLIAAIIWIVLVYIGVIAIRNERSLHFAGKSNAEASTRQLY